MGRDGGKKKKSRNTQTGEEVRAGVRREEAREVETRREGEREGTKGIREEPLTLRGLRGPCWRDDLNYENPRKIQW